MNETEEATSTVNPNPPNDWRAAGIVPEAATVTANTDPARYAFRLTASAPVTSAPAMKDSVVMSRLFWLNEPARATARMLLVARLSEPVTARMRVSLRLSRVRSPCASVMTASSLT